MLPTLCLPPVVCCFGTSPIQAARPRPDLNALAKALQRPLPDMVLKIVGLAKKKDPAWRLCPALRNKGKNGRPCY
jgi:hypothetical protein